MTLRWLVPALALLAAPLSAQGGTTRVVLISGLSGEPRFATQFLAAAGTVYDAAVHRWHVADSNITWLGEDPAVDPRRIRGRATKESIAAAFDALGRQTHAGDVDLIFLVGHGAGDMETSALNVAGPDPTVLDYARWLTPLDAASVVFINTATASGDFARFLRGPNRVIVTSTKTAVERNESEFAGFIAHALASDDADANKDGSVSVAEAFTFARDQVKRSYESTNRLLTEHAVLSDSSGIADRVAFGGAASSADPRILTLMGERRVLEQSVDSLRRNRSSSDSLAYQNALEKLLVEIATKTRAIAALQHPGSP
jgi:hypothetical protein